MADTSLLLGFGGLALGAVIGGAARATDLCSLTAIANVFYRDDYRMAWAWSVALFVAVIGTQSLILLGWLDLNGSFYLVEGLAWGGVLIGGLMFGFGMAIVGTCGFGTLVRAGGGDLRALIDAAIIGIFAYIAIAGFLSGPRLVLVDLAYQIDGGQGLPNLLSKIGLSDEASRGLAVAGSISAVAFLAWRASRTARGRRLFLAGILIGLCVVGGWTLTGIYGADPYEPASLRSLSFVRPMGDVLVAVMLGAVENPFSVMTVPGVILGAGIVAYRKGEFDFESFEGGRETLRHFAGAALMGVGGILALGCTVGQGLSAMSALSIAAPVALAMMWLGAWLGLYYLEQGGMAGILRRLRSAA